METDLSRALMLDPCSNGAAGQWAWDLKSEIRQALALAA
jgi:hypothetical protein